MRASGQQRVENTFTVRMLAAPELADVVRVAATALGYLGRYHLSKGLENYDHRVVATTQRHTRLVTPLGPRPVRSGAEAASIRESALAVAGGMAHATRELLFADTPVLTGNPTAAVTPADEGTLVNGIYRLRQNDARVRLVLTSQLSRMVAGGTTEQVLYPLAPLVGMTATEHILLNPSRELAPWRDEVLRRVATSDPSTPVAMIYPLAFVLAAVDVLVPPAGKATYRAGNKAGTYAPDPLRPWRGLDDGNALAEVLRVHTYLTEPRTVRAGLPGAPVRPTTTSESRRAVR